MYVRTYVKWLKKGKIKYFRALVSISNCFPAAAIRPSDGCIEHMKHTMTIEPDINTDCNS